MGRCTGKRALFSWFDLEKPIWWEAPVMMALERPDSMGSLNNHYNQYAMYDGEAWGRKRDTARFAGLHGYSDYSLHLMYRYWNLGWMAPPGAGAASGMLRRVVVSNGPLAFFEPKLHNGVAGCADVSRRYRVTSRNG